MKLEREEDRMMQSFVNSRRLLIAGLVAAGALFTLPVGRAAGDDAGATVRPVASEKLPNVPGKSITAVVVTYAPGGKSGSHRHAGSVMAYVLSGAIRSENSATGPAKVYKAGESFFEPPGSAHLVSENASATEPASLLAVFVADDGAQLTMFDK
jgi:quercetin dioxygenase-like cupin family protein